MGIGWVLGWGVIAVWAVLLVLALWWMAGGDRGRA